MSFETKKVGEMPLAKTPRPEFEHPNLKKGELISKQKVLEALDKVFGEFCLDCSVWHCDENGANSPITKSDLKRELGLD